MARCTRSPCRHGRILLQLRCCPVERRGSLGGDQAEACQNATYGIAKCRRAEGGRSRGRLGITLMQVRSLQETCGQRARHRTMPRLQVNVVGKRGSIWIGKLWGNSARCMASVQLRTRFWPAEAVPRCCCAHTGVWTAANTFHIAQTCRRVAYGSLREMHRMPARNARKNFPSRAIHHPSWGKRGGSLPVGEQSRAGFPPRKGNRWGDARFPRGRCVSEREKERERERAATMSDVQRE